MYSKNNLVHITYNHIIQRGTFSELIAWKTHFSMYNVYYYHRPYIQYLLAIQGEQS